MVSSVLTQYISDHRAIEGPEETTPFNRIIAVIEHPAKITHPFKVGSKHRDWVITKIAGKIIKLVISSFVHDNCRKGSWYTILFQLCCSPVI